MKESLRQDLYKKYPSLLTDKCFDFSIDDGWYDLVDTLCNYISLLIETTKENCTCVVHQVKEKLGGLRFYCYVETEDTELEAKINGLIMVMEGYSYRVCEVCGDKGMLCAPNGFWKKTRCNKHNTTLHTPSGRRKGSVALDFDGVINSYTSGFVGIAKLPDPPVPGAIEYIEELVKYGFKVYVYSTRNEQEAGRKAIYNYLQEHGLSEEILAKVGIVAGKPKAKIYLDDRAWEFTGTFPTPLEIEHFQPWHRGLSSSEKDSI